MKRLIVGLLMLALLAVGGVYVVKNPDGGGFDFLAKPDGSDAAESHSDGSNSGGSAEDKAVTAALTAPTTEPATEEDSQTSPFEGLAPFIGTVRIDKDGSVVLAGDAGKDGVTRVVLDGTVIQEVEPDSKGQFVAMFDLPASDEPRVLTLQNQLEGGDIIESDSRIIISPETITTTKEEAPETETAMAQEGAAPTVLRETPQGVDVLQAPQEDLPPDQVVLDAITYSEEGHVTLKGRAVADGDVQV